MTKILQVAVLMLLTANFAFAQSGRTASASTSTAATGDRPLKELFDEVNGFVRAKGAEYDSKKIMFSDRLLKQARSEQRRLAANYAAVGEKRQATGGDLFYLGMLHW